TKCEVKRYKRTTLVGLRDGVERIRLLHDLHREVLGVVAWRVALRRDRRLPAGGAQVDAVPGQLTAQQTADVSAGSGKCDLHRALSGGDLRGKCRPLQSRLVVGQCRMRDNDARVSTDVPLVLCSLDRKYDDKAIQLWRRSSPSRYDHAAEPRHRPPPSAGQLD